jgi:flagellar hook assembly protein FlgD
VITYSLPGAAEVELAVYDLSGRRVSTVARGSRASGVHEEHVALTDETGRPLPAGVYLYRLTAGNDAATRKFVITD